MMVLFGLVLAPGTLAINGNAVENIHRFIGQGYLPFEAALCHRRSPCRSSPPP
jgi:hypothetical protein